MKQITCQQVRDTLKYRLRLVKPNRIWLFDKHYTALSKEEFLDFAKDIEPIGAEFTEELFDCEDFAHVFSACVKLKAITEKKYPRGVAFGEITARNTMLGGVHTLNFLVTDNEEAHYFEPSENAFIDGEEYEPFYARI